MKFAVDHAFHIGQQHLREGQPCQDYALSGLMPGGAYAIVSDGCSTGGRTDVGSRLMALGMATAIQQVPRLLPAEDYVSLQRAQVDTSARVLRLPQNDLLATCVYAVAREDGSRLIHILGDGVIAIKNRDGSLLSHKIDWAQNMPAYPAYQRDDYASFVEAQGGPDSMAMSLEGFVDGPAGDLIRFCGSFSVRLGLAGHQIKLDRSIENIAAIAVFSDGVCQIEGISWEEAVRGLLDFKSVAGDFAKRRLRGFLKFAGEKGRGPIDDISMAVIRFDDGDAA